jgi:Pyruvate/2-oxoacid:ferredoxin oxidoreductase delta subunit
MVTKTVRKVVRIDEEKCNGCGACLISCAEGALQIIDGKAKLISDKYCDGLGACLGECPQGAITIEEREAEGFDEEAVARHLQTAGPAEVEPACGCSSATVTRFQSQAEAQREGVATAACESRLSHWPVQLALVPPSAPFLQGADLVLAADCVPFAYGGFHQDFLGDNALVVACPKLDDFGAHQARLTEIVRSSGIKSLTVVHMEVPCCSGLVHMAKQAVLASGRDLPLKEVTIGIKGERKASK